MNIPAFIIFTGIVGMLTSLFGLEFNGRRALVAFACFTVYTGIGIGTVA